MRNCAYYLKKYAPLLNRTAWKYARTQEDYEDNQQIGRLAIFRRWEKYEPGKHNEFFFFSDTIKNAIRNNYNRKQVSVQTVDNPKINNILYGMWEDGGQ